MEVISVLLNLKVLNGDMPLKFDKYVNIYTVTVASNITSLEIEYKINDLDEIKISNNEDFEYGQNYVYIEIINGEEKNLYTLEVYRCNETNVIKYETFEKNEAPLYTQNYNAYIHLGIILSIIVILAFLIFSGKREK